MRVPSFHSEHLFDKCFDEMKPFILCEFITIFMKKAEL